MSDRITKVNAYTTLDLVAGEAVGADWSETAPGVLDVTSPKEAPEHVELRVELDGVDLERLPTHADRVELTAEQARAVAAELTRHANRVEDATDD